MNSYWIGTILQMADSLINLFHNMKLANTNTDLLVNLIHIQKEKEQKNNIWINSIYKDLPSLQSNNIGIVGEMLIQKLCELLIQL